MQRMVMELEDFAQEFNITFSTDPVPHKSKTKCLYFVGNKRNKEKPAPLTLCGRVLPFVKQSGHLDNILTEIRDMMQLSRGLPSFALLLKFNKFSSLLLQQKC